MIFFAPEKKTPDYCFINKFFVFFLNFHHHHHHHHCCIIWVCGFFTTLNQTKTRTSMKNPNRAFCLCVCMWWHVGTEKKYQKKKIDEQWKDHHMIMMIHGMFDTLFFLWFACFRWIDGWIACSLSIYLSYLYHILDEIPARKKKQNT